MDPQQVLLGDAKLPAALGAGSSKSFPRVNLRKTHAQRRKEMARTRKGKNPAAPLAGSVSLGGQPSFFLRTKLLPPRPAPELLPRPRLSERLLANLAHPVT